MQTTTERPARVAGELYLPTDISPEQVFQAIGRLRREAQDEIDRLLAFLDETDGYSTTEQEINGDEADASFPEGGARCIAPMEDDEDGGDAEPSLGFQTGDIFVGRGCEHGGSGDDREVENEHDEDNNDREGDELQHGGDEHDGTEPDEDGEPSLGWTEQMAQGQGTWGSTDDKEESGSYITDAARQRYEGRFTADRYAKDGRHVDTERCFDISKRRLTNLSDPQRVAVAPRLNPREVRL